MVHLIHWFNMLKLSMLKKCKNKNNEFGEKEIVRDMKSQEKKKEIKNEILILDMMFYIIFKYFYLILLC